MKTINELMSDYKLKHSWVSDHSDTEGKMWLCNDISRVETYVNHPLGGIEPTVDLKKKRWHKHSSETGKCKGQLYLRFESWEEYDSSSLNWSTIFYANIRD